MRCADPPAGDAKEAAPEGAAKEERKMPTAGAAAHEATVGDKELKGGNVKKALQHYKKALGEWGDRLTYPPLHAARPPSAR